MKNGLHALSPAYDLVPQLTNIGYTGMAIVDNEMDANLDTALKHVDQFGLTTSQGGEIIQEVLKGVSDWKHIFTLLGADNTLMKRVESCFGKQARRIVAS